MENRDKNVLLLILLLFWGVLMCTAQHTAVFKPIGAYTWVKKSVISNPEKLSYKTHLCKVNTQFIPKQKHEVYKRKTSLYREDVERSFIPPAEQPVTFNGKVISPVKKIAAPPFLFKDNSVYDISYTDQAHGFISNYVTGITEDNDKNIWVATSAGLVKYDGSFYYMYTTESGLISNSINNIEYDKTTGLWIATSQGIALLRNDSVFEPVFTSIKNSELNVIRTNFDGRKNIWVNTLNQGALKFTLSLQTVQQFDTACGLTSNTVQNVVMDKAGNYWVTGKGLQKIEGRSISRWNSSKHFFNDDQWCVLLEDADTMWVGTFDNCIFKITPTDTIQLSVFPNFMGRVYSLIKSDGVVWFTLYGGGGLVYLKGDDYIIFDKAHGLSGDAGFDLHKDTYGNIWVSTYDAGISRLNASGIVTDYKSPDFLQAAATIKRGRDGNRWYFLNGGGLYKETTTGYEFITNQAQKPLPSVRHFMDGIINADGTAWLASYSYGIAHYDKKNITFYYYSDDPVKRVLLSAAMDGKNNPWFATMDYGLINVQGKDFFHITTADGLASNTPRFVRETPDGSIFYFSEKGLQKISNDTIYDFNVNNKPFRFEPFFLHSLMQGDFVIATDKGLLRMKDGLLYTLDTTGFFDCYTISNIMEDSTGALWFNNSQGIVKAQLNGLTLSNIQQVKAGNKIMLAQIISTGYVDDKNAPHWSSVDGFLTFKPELESALAPVPHFSFLGATVNDSSASIKDLPNLLPSDELTVLYSVVCWGSEDALIHKYALINVHSHDTVEHTISEKGVLVLSNLHTGTYQLVLIATLGEKKFYSMPVNLKVKPHWYNSVWFYALCIVLLMGLIYLLFRFRTARLQKAKADLETLVTSRTAALTASLAEREILLKEIHHRVKNNLQVISGLLELQKEEMTDEKVKAAFSEGQSRVRSVALIHHNLYQNEALSGIFFKSFASDLVKYMAEVFEERNKKLSVEILGEDANLDIDTAVPLGLIINELLTNAYKYAIPENKPGVLTLELKIISEGQYELVCKDNGPGIKGTINFEDATTLGLRLIKGLIGQLAGSVSYHYEGGAVFTFNFKDAEARRKE